MIVYKLFARDTTNNDTGLHTAECNHVRREYYIYYYKCRLKGLSRAVISEESIPNSRRLGLMFFVKITNYIHHQHFFYD